MRRLEASEVAQLVQHPNVQSGKWKSPYDIYDWRLAANLPSKFQPVLGLVRGIRNPIYDLEPEAWRVEDDTPILTSLHLAMRSQGSAPLKMPLFGRPVLNLREVLSPPLDGLLERLRIKLRYREFLRVEMPGIFFELPEGENSDIFHPGLVPAYDRVIVKPFWLFEGEGDRERVVAEDPFRVVLHISGAPIYYIIAELRRMGFNNSAIRSVIFNGSRSNHVL